MRDSLGNLTYLHSDHLGSVSLATTSNGNIASQQYFDAWGKVKSGGIGQTSLNYTGQRLDGTGLLYYNARYYDPALGKFLSPDNVDDGVNRYAYVHNNPLNKADPTGHCPWCIIGAIGGAVIGGVADAGVQFFTTGKVDVGQVALATLTGAVIGGTMGVGATAFAGGAGAAEVATTVGGAVAAETTGAVNEIEGLENDVANATSEGSSTFYTVQNATDAARLKGSGEPWPTDPTRSALGEGVYAWGDSETAGLYKAAKEATSQESLETMQFSVDNAKLSQYNQVNLTTLSDNEQNAFLEQQSKLYGGTPDTSIDYIQRGTKYGTEHYFNKTVFNDLDFGE